MESIGSHRNTENLRFKIEDYVVLVAILSISAVAGLFLSVLRHKQSSVTEYFLAGRNIGLPLVLLSFFASFASGTISSLAIETYAYGAQPILVAVSFPFIVLYVYHILVPVFYKLNNISMIKYFEVRFGNTVYLITLFGMLFIMIALGTVNVYVAAVALKQVSALTIWTSVGIMTLICIIYSTLGGMRGIVIADAIQAIIMITAILFIFITGVVKGGGASYIWNINKKYERLNFFNFDTDPTVRHTIWSTVIGYSLFTIAQLATNQSLLQRCLMTKNLKESQKMASIATSMTFMYVFTTLSLGIVIFGFHSGCNVIQIGVLDNINQLIPHFAMVILHEYPCFPGLYFSGLLCATLSTVSSNLNSISAIIMQYIIEHYNVRSETVTTVISKVLVVVFGGIMTLGIVLVDNFHNVAQASISFSSVIVGPIFTLLCIGMLCPQVNQKAATISLLVAIAYSFWIVVGTVVLSPVIPTPPFASNCTAIGVNATTLLSQTPTDHYLSSYFPLSKVSYMYNCAQGMLMTTFCFIFTSIIFGFMNKFERPNVSQITLDLIPPCIQKIQMKMSKRMRGFFLCDVYDDVNVDSNDHLVFKTRHIQQSS
ncbi:Sodium-coupled monocarboxylate transporter 1 [Chamberlinius hualienensis]